MENLLTPQLTVISTWAGTARSPPFRQCSQAINNHLVANSIHTQLNTGLEHMKLSVNIQTQEQSCCYCSQIHYSQCSFYLIIYLASSSEYSVYEFGSVVFSTNGYYHDKHKWFSPVDHCNRAFCSYLHLSGPFPLVCASVMREESGTCCISIRPSKRSGHLWQRPLTSGWKDQILVFACQKWVQTKA